MPTAWDGEISRVFFFLELRASLINIQRRNNVVLSGKAEHGYGPQINRHLVVREKIIIADQKGSIRIGIPINQLSSGSQTFLAEVVRRYRREKVLVKGIGWRVA